MRAVQRLFLDFSALNDAEDAAWRAWLEAALAALGLAPDMQKFSGAPSVDDGAFAFVSGSAGLSRKLLLNVSDIYIRPFRAPHQVDACLLRSGSSQQEDREAFWPLVSLITSVFRGDEFLPGFLSNMTALSGYAQCEHWLIRAASPGSEHAVLIEHVQNHPHAVYVNLSHDPGLYAVWNFGLQLSSGRYISNANLDDRRSTSHLVHLQAALQQHPQAVVASTPLYISTQKNLDWPRTAQRDNCPQLFTDKSEHLYGLAGLFRQTPQGPASHNKPHCMPLWRRSLHCLLGDFDEMRYGPSADWAFWLKAAALGAKFYIGKEPLGLYLRNDSSYWKRNQITHDFDRRIVKEFFRETLSDEKSLELAAGWRAVGQEMVTAVDLLRSGAVLDGIGRLLQAGRRLDIAGVVDSAWPDSASSAQHLVNMACWRYLGCRDGWGWLLQNGAGAGLLKLGALGAADDIATSAVFNALVDLVQDFDWQTAPAVAQRNLLLACHDWQACFADERGVLLLALIARRRDKFFQESELLLQSYQADPLNFWHRVQSVYRFTRTLPDLCAAVGAFGAVSNNTSWSATRSKRSIQTCRVAFYPEYSNQYQNLLYAPLRAAGGSAHGFKSLKPFMEMDEEANILHVHWVNQFFGDPALSSEKAAACANEFLAFLQQKKAAGCEILWTIHNELSHEITDAAAELAFRRALYKVADRVFVHHPSVLALLDWLPQQDGADSSSKLNLCEHGAYEATALMVSRQQARRALGLAEDEWLLAYVGQMRDYKGLDVLLPALLKQLDALPSMRLLLAGKVLSEPLRSWLAQHAHPRLTVYDKHVDDETFVYMMRAANVGLLAYRKILTSGSLFHWLSCKRPVIAPALGTIPAYVVNDWNGWLYKDTAGLSDILGHAAALSENAQLRLEQNAQQTIQQLEWRMWH